MTPSGNKVQTLSVGQPFRKNNSSSAEHIPSRVSMSTISSFKSMKNNYDTHKCKEYVEKFCESIREREDN